MIEKVKNRIVCAAMRIDIGVEKIIIPSPRHLDKTARELAKSVIPHMLLKNSALVESELHLLLHESDQGFIDKHGEFHSRTEAWTIAFDAGQIFRRVGGDETDGGTLYSENLY